MQSRLLISGDSDVHCELNALELDCKHLEDKNHVFLLTADNTQYSTQCLDMVLKNIDF